MCIRPKELHLGLLSSMFLPNHQPMEEWFATVHGLPAAWPDLSMIGSENMRKVTARDLQDIRIRYQVSSMWGTISPNWELLHKHLTATAPTYYTSGKGRAVIQQSIQQAR